MGQGVDGREVKPRELRMKVRDEKRRRQRVVDNDYGTLILTRTRRAVRVTAVVKPGRLAGQRPATLVGFVDLDDASVDRLIRRLQAIRGGKRAL